jgi:membrane protein YqaA with SNARE-associated domain
MAGERVELSSHSWHNGTSTNKTILDIVHFNYAWVLFVIFLVAFVANSILAAEPSAESKEPILTGPGGKPLPRSARKAKEERDRKKKLKDFSPVRKLLFLHLSAGILATFVANGANIVVHALTKRENGWWCGEAMAVSGNWE